MATGITDEEIAKTVKDSAGPTDEELDVIYARASRAEPGPWRSTWEDGSTPIPTDTCDDEIIVEAVGREGVDRLVVGTMYYDGRWPACSELNAAFIAAARADVPRLVDALRAARQRERELRSLAAKLAGALVPFEEIADMIDESGDKIDGDTQVGEHPKLRQCQVRMVDFRHARDVLKDADRILGGAEDRP